MITAIKKMDDDYIVRLPENIIKRMKMAESEVVQIFEEYGRIIIQKSTPGTISNDTSRPTIEELFKNFDGEYEPIDIDWGTPQGKEIW